MPRKRKRSNLRKGAPAAMVQPEPLKVFLQHRIRSIISKEWWDFVVNVNNMNSDHASLLYSVANLCPSFQNFLRTRDKELGYILRKRPLIKPRVFSGAEKIEVPTVVTSKEVFSTQTKSCSAELDQILSNLYPQERSIIKRKPRTFGPISKQRRMQSMKKYQASLQAKKEATAVDTNSETLSKLLREDNPCTTAPESTTPSSSRDDNHNVEYTISNYDVNRNKLSLNMKKVKKKIIKVKKKILTYTDNNDKSRTKYLLENETPDLKRELIKKYRIKKCSVVLERLSRKQINDMRAKTKSTHLINLLGDCKSIKTPSTSSKVSKAPATNKSTDTNITISLKELIANSITNGIPKDKVDNGTNKALLQNTLNQTCKALSKLINTDMDDSAIKPEAKCKKSTENMQTENKVHKEFNDTMKTNRNIESSLMKCDNTLSSENSQKMSNNNAEDNDKQKIPSTKVDVILKSKISNKITSLLSDKTETSSIGLKPENKIDKELKLIESNGMNSISVQSGNSSVKSDLIDKVSPNSNLPVNTANNSEDKCDEPSVKRIKLERSNSPTKDIGNSLSVAQQVEAKSSTQLIEPSNAPKNQTFPDKTITDNVINDFPKSPEKEQSDGSNISTNAKYRLNQKENFARGEKYKPKEFVKDLKDLYCHGAIVPLGKMSVSVIDKSSFDKNKHFLSLKEKKIKESPSDTSDSISPLKEKNIQSSTTESKSEIAPLNGLKNVDKVIDTPKPVDKISVVESSVIKSEDKNDKIKDSLGANSSSEDNVSTINSNITKSAEPNATKESGDNGPLNTNEEEDNSKDDSGSEKDLIIDETVKDMDETIQETGMDVEETIDKIAKEVQKTMDEIANKVQKSMDDVKKVEVADKVAKEVEVADKVIAKEVEVIDEVAKEVEVTTSALIEDDEEINDGKDDVILIETPLEVIEIDSQDEDDSCSTVIQKIKVEKIVFDTSTDPKIVSNENSSSIPKDFVVLSEDNGDDSSTGIGEHEHKRPRLEINLTKMQIDNTNCKLCDTIFSSHVEWLQHFDNDVPKCAPNLKVSWDRPEFSLIN